MEWQVYRDSCKQHLADVVLQYVDCAETIVLTWGTMGISLEREVHSITAGQVTSCRLHSLKRL